MTTTTEDHYKQDKSNNDTVPLIDNSDTSSVDTIPSFDLNIPTPKIPLDTERDFTQFNIMENHVKKWKPKFHLGEPILAHDNYLHPFFAGIVIGYIPTRRYLISFPEFPPTFGIVEEINIQNFDDEIAEKQSKELRDMWSSLPSDFDPRHFDYMVNIVRFEIANWSRMARANRHIKVHKDFRKSEIFLKHMAKYTR